VRPRRICNWVVVQASESIELLVAKDKRGAVLDNLPCFSHMADHQPPYIASGFPEVVIPPVVDTCTLRMRGRQREPRRLMD
jgi:hypothetical protein